MKRFLLFLSFLFLSSNCFALTQNATAASAYFSPYNWIDNHNGTIESQTPGAYVIVKFTGTSLSAAFNVTNVLANLCNTGDCPQISVSTDNGAFVDQSLSSSSQVLVSGLSAGAHTAFCIIKEINPNVDRWNTPLGAIIINTFTIDTAASFSTPQTFPKRTIIYGDSIVEGINADNFGGTFSYTMDNSYHSYAFLLRNLLQSEVGIVGYGFQGWEYAGTGNIPYFENAWNYLMNGVPRVFTPQPNYIFIDQGTNDCHAEACPSDLTTVITTTLNAIHTANLNAKIFVLIPFGRNIASQITAGVAAVGNNQTHIIDLGSNGITYTASPTYSIDDLHPNQAGHAALVALIYQVFFPYLMSSYFSGVTLNNVTII